MTIRYKTIFIVHCSWKRLLPNIDYDVNNILIAWRNSRMKCQCYLKNIEE
jgi:hypothetical protein